MEIKDTIALRKLADRLSNKIEQIDNGKLRAGSPMYFYCSICGYPSDVKPEDYTDRPKRRCKECQELLDVNPDLTSSTIVEMAKKLI